MGNYTYAVVVMRYLIFDISMLDNDSKINDTHKTTPDDHDIDPTAGSSKPVAHQNPQYLGIDTELFELENAEGFVGVDGTP